MSGSHAGPTGRRRSRSAGASDPLGIVTKRTRKCKFAAIGEDVVGDDELVIQARIRPEVVAGAEAAVPLVTGPYDNPPNPRRECSTRTQRAGLSRDDQLRVQE